MYAQLFDFVVCRFLLKFSFLQYYQVYICYIIMTHWNMTLDSSSFLTVDEQILQCSHCIHVLYICMFVFTGATAVVDATPLLPYHDALVHVQNSDLQQFMVRN